MVLKLLLTKNYLRDLKKCIWEQKVCSFFFFPPSFLGGVKTCLWFPFHWISENWTSGPHLHQATFPWRSRILHLTLKKINLDYVSGIKEVKRKQISVSLCLCLSPFSHTRHTQVQITSQSLHSVCPWVIRSQMILIFSFLSCCNF